MPSPTIIWFRQDLRLSDNPALLAATERGGPVIALYVLDDLSAGDWRIGGASRWWLHQSLRLLDRGLRDLGSKLILRRGEAGDILDELVESANAEAVFWNRCYEPTSIVRDREIKSRLQSKGLDVRSFNGSLLAEPWEIETKTGTPYRVFTPFWKALVNSVTIAKPLEAPHRLAADGPKLDSDKLEDWSLEPSKPDWAGGLRESWQPGEAGAHQRLALFMSDGLQHYARGRDIPSQDFTSRLSPHLHWGEISPRQIWSALEHSSDALGNIEKLKSELGWREFSYHLLYHTPQLPNENLRPEFNSFPWKPDEQKLIAWQQGRTGYPIVDAGMRQLWHTGWMHNRVRMIAASFLVKHLLQPWQDGAAWFWDTLVDADLASNSASWQWVAGCGADAAPYFRIFSPVLQGEKFDPDGHYVKHWLPELTDVPLKKIHKPWTLDTPPSDYPAPIIDLAEGRNRALKAYETMKNAEAV